MKKIFLLLCISIFYITSFGQFSIHEPLKYTPRSQESIEIEYAGKVNIYYISNNEIKATPLKKDLYYQEVGNRTVFYIQEGRKYHKVQKNPLYGKVGYAEGQFEFRYYVFE